MPKFRYSFFPFQSIPMFILILHAQIEFSYIMNYQETLKYLFGKLPMYQRQGKTALKKKLDNIRTLCKHSDNPHHKFKSIHIGGTNGKGSVSHILASVLQTAGYKTGLYTSPHLKDFRERIKINGEMISENKVINYVEKNKSFFEKIQPSFFEMTVALAFEYFAEQEVDIAIIEVGLGGRLDSTNIINPLVSVITNISLDHTQFLGETLPEIAKEKAGIIKKNTPIILGEFQKETAEIFIYKAKAQNAVIYFADKEYSVDYEMLSIDYKQILNIRKNRKILYPDLKTDLIGIYQKKNIICALKTVEILSDSFEINKDDIYKGILYVAKNTNFKGRWQILGYNPLIIADTGHNEAGIKEIISQLEKTAYKKLYFIFGTVNDKNLAPILSLLPKNAIYYFTKAQIPRALDESLLFQKAKKFKLKGQTFNTVNEAFKHAKKQAEKEDLIFIGGSTFIVAEVI